MSAGDVLPTKSRGGVNCCTSVCRSKCQHLVLQQHDAWQFAGDNPHIQAALARVIDNLCHPHPVRIPKDLRFTLLKKADDVFPRMSLVDLKRLLDPGNDLVWC